MSAILDFQQKLITDAATRKAFSENPRKVLSALGVRLPPNTNIPATIPLREIEAQVKQVRNSLKEENIDLRQLDVTDPAAATRVIEEAVPLRSRDFREARTIQRGLAGGGEAATVVVVGAVVVAVVAAKVSVVAETQTSLVAIEKQARGLEGVSRSPSGFVVHGPNDIRFEGLDAAAVVDVIKGLR